jgi:hypothetical protein
MLKLKPSNVVIFSILALCFSTVSGCGGGAQTDTQEALKRTVEGIQRDALVNQQKPAHCTVSGDINTFTIDCTKAIDKTCLGSVCVGNSLSLGSITINKVGTSRLAGTALGQSSLSLEIKHTDGSVSMVKL